MTRSTFSAMIAKRRRDISNQAPSLPDDSMELSGTIRAEGDPEELGLAGGRGGFGGGRGGRGGGGGDATGEAQVQVTIAGTAWPTCWE